MLLSSLHPVPCHHLHLDHAHLACMSRQMRLSRSVEGCSTAQKQAVMMVDQAYV